MSAGAAAADATLASALYVGTVRHRRFAPVAHALRYPVFMAYLDLSELDAVFQAHRAWSTRGPALVWFRRADHFGNPHIPLDAAVRALVAERTGYRPSGPVRTLAHLRHFGIGMMPASFHYCFASDGATIAAIVVEVHNTPWREKHCYVLDAHSLAPGAPLVFDVPKAFHVSPFMGMDVTYRFRIGLPGERIGVEIENRRGGLPYFDASLALERRAIDAASLGRVLREHPFMTLRVLAGIYGHAVRLWRKGVPYHPHPRDPRRGEGGGST